MACPIDFETILQHHSIHGDTVPLRRGDPRPTGGVPACVHRGRLHRSIPAKWISCGCGEVRLYECRHHGGLTIERPVNSDAWPVVNEGYHVDRICATCPDRDTQSRTRRRRERKPRDVTRVVFGFPRLLWAGVEQWLAALLAGFQRQPGLPLIPSVAVVGECDPVLLTQLRELAEVRQGDACAELVRNADVCVVWALDSLPHWLTDFDGPVYGCSHGVFDWWMAQNDHWIDGWLAVSKVATQPLPRPATAIIHNGVDTERLRPTMTREIARRSLGLRPDDIGVGIVARLSAEKRHAEAVKRWHHTPANYRLVIVGAGAMEAELRALAAPLGDRVIFAGLRRDVGNVYHGLDATLLLSDAEGFALVIAESLLVGLPTIVTPVGGVPELPSILMGPQPCHVVHDLDSLPWVVMHAIGKPYRRHPADNLEYLTADAMARRWAAFLADV